MFLEFLTTNIILQFMCKLLHIFGKLAQFYYTPKRRYAVVQLSFVALYTILVSNCCFLAWLFLFVWCTEI